MALWRKYHVCQTYKHKAGWDMHDDNGELKIRILQTLEDSLLGLFYKKNYVDPYFRMTSTDLSVEDFQKFLETRLALEE